MRRFQLSATLSVVLLVLVAGCGDSETQVTTSGGGADSNDSTSAPAAPSAPVAPSGPAAPTAAPAADPAAADPAMAGADPMATPNPGPADPMPNQPQNKAALSDNFAEWQPDDFRTAARKADARLKPAIDSLVARTPGDAQTAELLVELLKLLGESASNSNGGGLPGDPAGDPAAVPAAPADPAAAPGIAPAAFSPSSDPQIMQVNFQPEAAPTDPAAPAAAPTAPGGPMPMPIDPMAPGGPMGQQRGGSRAALVHDVINGLARNGSPRAWQGLKQVLAGEIKTSVSEHEVTDWVISSALDNYGGSGHPTHAFLEQALKNPQSLNASRGEEMRRQVDGIFAGTAAAILDQLMGVPASGQPPRHSQSGPGGPGAEPMPMPVQSPMPAAAPGLQAGGEPGGGLPQPGPFHLHKRPMTDEGIRNSIRYLWQAETLNYLEVNTLGIADMNKGIGTLALAGSLPTSGMRKATFDLLNGRWEEGANPLISARLYQSVARDPGLIVVLKQLPRLMPTGQQRNQQNPYANPNASKSQRESAAKQDWMQLSAMMVRAVTARLQASTQDSSLAASPPKLPIKLHRDAQIRGVRTLNWPEDIADVASGGTAPGALSLQYVRMDAPADVPKVFEFYKKQVKRGKDYKFPSGAWIDGNSVGSEIGKRRSIDILFTQNTTANSGEPGGPAGPGGAPVAGDVNQPIGGQQQAGPQYTIEVLIVEIADPKTPGKR